MMAWYFSYLAQLICPTSIFVYDSRKAISEVHYLSTTIILLTYSMSPLYLWVHTRYMPYGTDSFDLMLITITIITMRLIVLINTLDPGN